MYVSNTHHHHNIQLTSLLFSTTTTTYQPLVFWGWIFNALVESTFISALPLFTLAQSGSSGTSESFLMAGMTAFTVIVLVVNFKVRIPVYTAYSLCVHVGCAYSIDIMLIFI